MLTYHSHSQEFAALSAPFDVSRFPLAEAITG
jgi:hypothetical protein